MPLKIIAIIPARGGSKGIPRKNVKLLAGEPLIGHCLKTALSVKALNKVIVSTDDEEIATVAKKYGAEVPFMRPPELATDEIPTLPVLQHALDFLKTKENYVPDYVLLVYPTSPLLKANRIQEAIDIAVKTNADSIISGTYDRGHYWQEHNGKWSRFYPTDITNRQAARPLFKENGAIYLTKASVLEKEIVGKNIVPLIMKPDETVDIDEPADFEKVAALLSSQ